MLYKFCMVLNPNLIRKIISLHKQGWNPYSIHRELKINRITVTKYCKKFDDIVAYILKHPEEFPDTEHRILEKNDLKDDVRTIIKSVAEEVRQT